MKRCVEKYWSWIFLLALCACVVSACGDNTDEPTAKERPSLSVSTLNLEVGDTVTLQVNNAEEINSANVSNPAIVSLRIDGTSICLKALAAGETVVNINVDGARLCCEVIVVEPLMPNYDFTPEIQNTQSRYVSPSLKMTYETPGTIFSVAHNGTIEVHSLITGNSITFNPGTIELTEGLLPNATLQVNGNNIELQEVTLEKLTPDNSMWLNLLDAKGNRIVLVITDM